MNPTVRAYHVESRMAQRLLQQVTTTSEAAGFISRAGAYVSTTFQEASVLNQAIVVIVLGLSICMVAFLALIWIAEYVGNKMHRESKVKSQKHVEVGTPVGTPVSIDLESPVKVPSDEEILQDVSASNKGVQLLINQSTDYAADQTVESQRARRQLNLKLKASPSLVTSHVLRKSSNFSPRLTSGVGMTVRKRSVARKGTYGANDHAAIVKPLTATDLSVIDSVQARDISRVGWLYNPHATRKSSHGMQAHLPGSNAGDLTLLHSHRTMDTVSTTGEDFRLPAASHHQTVTADEKMAIHNSITMSTGLNSPKTLSSAQSIGPNDLASLAPEEIEPADNGEEPTTVPRKDTKLGNVILLDPIQFQNEIVLIKLIGTGACGSVHEAIWRGSLCAVKIMHASRQVSKTSVDTFRKEVEFMSNMTEHQGVLRILAACLTPPHMCIITELAEEGSLHSILHERCLRPEYKTLLDVASQIADAIAFCHEKSLVHRDLKTHNILLNSKNRVIVADFGLAVDMDSNTMLSGGSSVMGTSSYMAPEQFSASKIDAKCDSYAFGCILWECITGRQPWEECNNLMQIVMAVGVERRRPPLPKGIPSPLASIIRECWRHNPALRPSMKEIAQRLRTLQREEEQALAFKAAAQLATKKSSPFAKARSKTPSPHSSPAKTPAQAWNQQWSPIKPLRH